MIVNPLGVVLAQGGPDETILIAEVNPSTVSETRERFPFLQDRR